jgi:hypothetical protein
LDASQLTKDGEYPVVLWGGDMPEMSKQRIAENFGEFLLNESHRL